jgi:TolB-like protein/Flp pilus assembly protein TadD
MAPEQAVGGSPKVSKATDTYGLGAVLYQLLTGQPPFAGGTTYETIKLLLDTEPRSPRLLNPKIGRDLCTICVKCLEKDPERRYASALVLAEDLEHWLKHESISARHTGIFTRGRKWVRRNPTSTLLAASLVALVAAAGWIWKSEFIRHPVTNGIAVLPFENLSPDPDNAYFADGIQEEILTRLASIANLKVISRTSTQHYQKKPRNLGEIAKQLGVANILEGSVQKAADQVRVNVQLINAQTDSHLWADSYDRKLTDIFGIESEVAKRIADSLQVKLGGRERQALAARPTNNPEAYDVYLRGLAFEDRTYFFNSMTPIAKALGFYERAVQLDPKFAVAWARLSRADAYFYINNGDSTLNGDSTPAAHTARGDAAKHALENAQKLEPDSPETLLALGYYQYYVLRDYGLAKTTFGRVSEMLPSNSQALMALGAVNRREGHWNESIGHFEQALALDPRNVVLLSEAANTYGMLRQFPAALKLFDRVLDIAPNDDVIAAKACIYQAQGNLQEAARLLSGISEQTPSGDAFSYKVQELKLERNYSEAVRVLQLHLVQFHYESDDDKASDQVDLAFIQRLAGDTAGARVTAEQARNTLERLYGNQPDAVAEDLSLAYALLGDKDSALQVANRAVMLLPRNKDALFGPMLEQNLAKIQTLVGEKSRAISILSQLLQTPYPGALFITPALLRLYPLWDPLRSDPAFQKLCQEKQPYVTP